MREIDCKLVFESPVVLVGGAKFDESVLLSLIRAGCSVVAADGGANILRKLGLSPSAIVGDLDSLQNIDHWKNQTKVLHIAEQDSTDFEKCLYTVKAPITVAIGFTGQRFDHTLVTLHLMQSYVDLKLLLVTGEDVCFAWRGDLTMRLPEGERFSLYPLTRTEFISSTGLKYPLNELTMEQGSLIGTSNRSVAGNVEVMAKQDGIYLVIVSLVHLQNLVGWLKHR